MNSRSVNVVLVVVWCLAVCADAVCQGQAAASASKPQVYSGLEMSVASVARASSAALQDCPPGANTQKGMARPGQQFAIVTIAFKVLASFKPGPLKRPVLTDAAGNTHNTAVSFVDIGSVPEFSCAFPFRVPEGTTLKTLQIDQATLDLTTAEARKP